ncbi:hypothetical protein ES703_123446 [subsurface metagenome]
MFPGVPFHQSQRLVDRLGEQGLLQGHEISDEEESQYPEETLILGPPIHLIIFPMSFRHAVNYYRQIFLTLTYLIAINRIDFFGIFLYGLVICQPLGELSQ